MTRPTQRNETSPKSPSPHLAAGRVALALTAALALAPAAAAQTVITVDDDGSGDHLSIQDALNVAGAADVVLVRDGTYPGFSISGQSAAVVADDGAAVRIEGSVRVGPHGPDQRVLLHGLEIEDGSRPLWLLACGGPVFIQECDLTLDFGPAYTLGSAALVEMSDKVVFTRVHMQSSNTLTVGLSGGGALRAVDSNVSLYDCFIDGGTAAINIEGQPGVVLDGGALFSSGSILRGGVGGAGGAPTAPAFCTDGKNGGPGLSVAAGSVRLLDCVVEGGVGGSTWGFCSDGDPGVPWKVSSAGTLQLLTESARSFDVDAVLREGGSTTLRLEGLPGDFAWLLLGLGDLPDMQASPALSGIFVPGLPWLPAFVGTVPASGNLVLPSSVGDLPAGFDLVRLSTQAVMGSQGAWVLGTPRMTWIVDAGS